MAVKGKPKSQRIDLLYSQSVEDLVLKNPIYGSLAKSKVLTEAQRKKKELDKQRRKATYDLSDSIVKEMNRIAYEESVPVSQIAHHFLVYAIREWRKGAITLVKKGSKSSPRYEFQLILPEIEDRDGDTNIH